MKIIGLPDIHGDSQKLTRLKEEIAQADLVLLVGDITNFGHKAQMKEMMQRVMAINSHCLAVPGNCDYQETEEIMKTLGVSLSGENRSIDGNTFLGLGASLATPFNGTPFEVTESYLEDKLQEAAIGMDPEAPMILVSHQPPCDTSADSLPNGMHVGSKAVRVFIEHFQPMVCFCGHIHEGIGIDSIGKTKIINPGPVFQGNYSYAEISDGSDLLEIRSIP